MKLPPLPSSPSYTGLYVYDFPRGSVFPAGHVSVGYTAAEIRILHESEAYRDGTAYEIYRVADEGTIELRAILEQRLTAWEAVCFLRADGAAAQRDYEELREAADRAPLPCAAELQLARLYEFDPQNLTGLAYSAAATTMVAVWLEKNGTDAGDRVVGGIDVYAKLASSDGLRIASCHLPTLIDYRDRPAEDVLRTVDKALQR